MVTEHSALESRTRCLRDQLKDLGYECDFSSDSVPLLELIIADLLQTTDTLRHFKTLAHDTLQVCRDLETSVDKCKQENAYLENKINRLRSSDYKAAEGDVEIDKDTDVRKLRTENKNLRERCAHLAEEIQEKQTYVQTCKEEINHLRNVIELEQGRRPSSETAVHDNVCFTAKIKKLEIQNEELKRRLERALEGQEEAKHNAVRLKEKCDQLEETLGRCSCQNASINEINKGKVVQDKKMKNLEEEISKLKAQYERLESKDNGRQKHIPTDSENYKYVQEIIDLKSSYRNLEKAKLDTEKELKEVKELYEKIKDTNSELEKDLLEVKRLCQEMDADKDRMTKKLAKAMDEAKISVDRSNKLKIIERDLTSEIGRLNSVIALQRRHVTELEQKVKDLFATKAGTKRKIPGSSLMIQKKPIEIQPKGRKPFPPKNSARYVNTEASVPAKDEEETEAEKYLSSLNKKYENEMKELGKKRVESTKLINTASDQLSASYIILQGRSVGTDTTELNKANDILPVSLPWKSLCDSIRRCEYCQLKEKSLADCRENVYRLESERRELLCRQNELMTTVECNNEHISQLRSHVHELEIELHRQRTECSKLKILQDRSKISVESSDVARQRLEYELKSSLDKIKELQMETSTLRRELESVEVEKSSLQNILKDLDIRKNTLMLSVDEKADRLINAERLLDVKENQIRGLERMVQDLQKKLDSVKTDGAKSEEMVHTMNKHLERLKSKLKEAEERKENLLAENRRLQNDLTVLTRDYAICRNDLEKCSRESSELRAQVHEYIEKVRTAEETLQQKEQEREEMLQHFRTLTVEATQLESNNHTLESEARSTKSSLRKAESKIEDLEHSIENKEALIRGYEEQMTSLTQNIARMETKIKQLTSERDQLQLDLSSCRELCNQMDDHRDNLSHSVSSLSAAKHELEEKCDSLQREMDRLQEEVSREVVKVSTLERLLAESQKENASYNDMIRELRDEIRSLKQKVKSLKEQLEISEQRTRVYQNEITEYQKQIEDLNRRLYNITLEQSSRFTSECFERNTL